MIQWRYVPGGVVKHAVGAHPGHLRIYALCGLEVWNIHDWHGTGTQEEHEELASRPRCRNCVKKIHSLPWGKGRAE